eukprot:scaffold111542_cov66-Phaeocystis_antarctica.AAC.1
MAHATPPGKPSAWLLRPRRSDHSFTLVRVEVEVGVRVRVEVRVWVRVRARVTPALTTASPGAASHGSAPRWARGGAARSRRARH